MNENNLILNNILLSSYWNKNWFDELFLELIIKINEGYQLNKLIELNLIKEEINGIYSFQIFNNIFCDFLLNETENYIKYCLDNNIPIIRPNSMNRYGLILNEIGMKDIITDLQQNYLLPISKLLFPIESTEFTDHHTFIVSYEPSRDRALDLHTDDSEVTWNICLGREGFIGSGLTFCGIMRESDHRQYKCSYHHKIGRAVVHLGKQRHGAEDITSGERHNLIIWCRNDTYRNSELYEIRARQYQKEIGPPDIRCLSYTHDRDYIYYKSNYPPNKNPFNLLSGNEFSNSNSNSDDDDDDNNNDDNIRKQQILQEDIDLPMPWCPPLPCGYDGIPTPNYLMKLVYTKLVEEEEEKARERTQRKIKRKQQKQQQKQKEEQEHQQEDMQQIE